MFIYLSLPVKTQAEEGGVLFQIEENVFVFQDNPIWQGTADSLLSCSQMCAKRPTCKRVNFVASKGTCSHLGEGQTNLANKLVKQDGSFYLRKVS